MTPPATAPAAWRRTLLTLAAAGLCASSPLAGTFVVTTTADAGPGSLRDAMQQAAADPDADVIDLTGVTGTILLQNDLPPLAGDTQLLGPGMDLLTLDGDDLHRPLRLIGEGPFVVSDLTVARGLNGSSSGGALTLSATGTGTSRVSRCRFLDNRAERDGAGARLFSADALLVEDCVVEGNTILSSFNDGAGLFVEGTATVSGCSFSGNQTFEFGDGGGLAADGDVLVSGCSFSGNQAGPFAFGGALAARGPSITLQDCSFTQNTADNRGGALDLGAQSVLVQDCDFIENQASRGGAVILDRGTLSGCLFQDNLADNQAGALLQDGNDEVQLLGCTFDGNRSERDGGAVSMDRGRIEDCVFLGNVSGEGSPFGTGEYGGALLVDSALADLTIERTRFEGNLADSGAAVGLAFTNTAAEPRLVLRDCLFRDNVARRRGGVLDTGRRGRSLVELVQCTLVGNQSLGAAPGPSPSVPDDGAGAIGQGGAHRVRLTHCTVVGNSAARSGGGLRAESQAKTAGSAGLTGQALPGLHLEDDVSAPVGGLTLINCLVAGNSAPRGADVFGPLSGALVGRNLIANPQGASGLKADAITDVDLVAAPQFGLLADNGGPLATLLLLDGSLALDAGDPAGALDADGLPLTADARGDGFPRVSGSGVDLGAVEAGDAAAPTLAAFDTLGPAFGSVPLAIQFVDQSSASATSWQWDFGDGNGSSDQQPLHVFSEPGSYTVTLTVTGPDNSDSEVKLNLVTAEPPYTDLGFALGGSQGLPLLVGEGELLAGTADTIVLSKVPANALGTLYMGCSRIDQEFKGGILVPAPESALVFTTDGAGQSISPLAIPDEAPGTAFYLQAWVQDPAAPEGFSGSNALRATIQ